MYQQLASAIAAPALASDRRQVSVLFADMVGFTEAVEQIGEEQALKLVRMIYDRLSAAVEAHGGSPRGFAGDGIIALFGVPDAQEDAALRACRAAELIRATFAAAGDAFVAAFGIRPTMRVGICSGIVVMAAVEGDGSAPTAVGDTVNVASRLQALAPPGGCLICDRTRRLVEWLVETSFDGEHAIKGKARPQKLWRLQAVREGARRFDASRQRGLTPYVGREAELTALREAVDRAHGDLQVIDVVAEAGLGKTRLIFEFLEGLKGGGAVVLIGNCAADGRKTPYLPFIEVIRAAFRLDADLEADVVKRRIEVGLAGFDLLTDENVGLLLNLLGMAPPRGSLTGLDSVLIGLRTRDLLPALLQARSRRGLVVLLIEDGHWIDPASEGLLKALVKTIIPPNLLILHTRRPEYAPPWLDSGPCRTLALKPLDPAEVKQLAETRLGSQLPDALLRQVTERAGGNPLFGEEILRFLIEQGRLRVGTDQVEFNAGSGDDDLPDSIQLLLAARMDGLASEDRRVLQAAAAIGRRFDLALLELLGGWESDLDNMLHRLEAQDFIAREGESTNYVFKHILVRDVVYQSLLTEQRAALHLRIAETLEARNAGRVAEVVESLAYHYGLSDRRDRAFTYLTMAGARSVSVFSLDAADRYFAAALKLYESDPHCASDDGFGTLAARYAQCCNIGLRLKTFAHLSTSALRVFARLGDSADHVSFLHHYVFSLIWGGRYRDALRVQQDLTAMARRRGDPCSIAFAAVSELAVSTYCAAKPVAEFQARQREAEAALASIDDANLTNLYYSISAYDELCRGRIAEARASVERLVAFATSINDPRGLGYGLAMEALIAMQADEFGQALTLAERARDIARAEFEKVLATTARISVLVPLGRLEAERDVRSWIGLCNDNDWKLFTVGPECWLGVAQAMNGRVGDGLRTLEAAIASRDREGFLPAADWSRLYLCEVYLAVLSARASGSPRPPLRDLPLLIGIRLFGARRIKALVARVRANPQFAVDGQYFGRTALILGSLYKLRKRRRLAARHLDEARRVFQATGPSALLTRIETALAEVS